MDQEIDIDRLQQELEYYKRRVNEVAGENLRFDYIVAALRHELKQKRQGFALLTELQQLLGTHRSLSAIYEITINAITVTLDMEKAVLLHPIRENLFHPTHWIGFEEEVTRAFKDLVLEFPPEFSQGKGLFLVTKSVPSTPLIEQIRSVFELPFFICLPVSGESRAIGLLLTGRSKEIRPIIPPLDQGDVDSLQAVAGLISALLRKMRLIVPGQMAIEGQIPDRPIMISEPMPVMTVNDPSPGESTGDDRSKVSTVHPNVLYVGEDTTLGNQIRDLLKASYEIVVASKVGDALNQIKRHLPDLILSDQDVSKRGKSELLNSLRANNEFRSIPVISLVERTLNNPHLDSIEAGADDYLIKPFSTVELLARMHNLLRARSQERRLSELSRQLMLSQDELSQTLRDVRVMQAQLIQQEKLASLGQVTAGIAHEIKNPLNFINNFAAVAREISDDLQHEMETLNAAIEKQRAEEIKTMLDDLRVSAEKIEEHGQRADRIVRSMLLHSRGTPGERHPVELNTLLSEFVDLAYHGMRAQIPDFDVTVEKNLDPLVGSVDIVPQEIGRVLLNLLNNAFDALREKASRIKDSYRPLVTVSSKVVGEDVQICVLDNGPGIPAAVRERIFEPFFTTKPEGRGTGLGLSMAHDIITLGHGGTIAVESDEGRSTKFCITLPLKLDGKKNVKSALTAAF